MRTRYTRQGPILRASIALACLCFAASVARGQTGPPADFQVKASLFLGPMGGIGDGAMRVRILTIDRDGRCHLRVRLSVAPTVFDESEYLIPESEVVAIWNLIVKEDFSHLRERYDNGDLDRAGSEIVVHHSKKTFETTVVDEGSSAQEKAEIARFRRVWEAVFDTVPTRLLSKYNNPAPIVSLPLPSEIRAVSVTLYDLEGEKVERQARIRDKKAIVEILDCLAPATTHRGRWYRSYKTPVIGKLEIQTERNETTIEFFKGEIRYLYYYMDHKEVLRDVAENKETRLARQKRLGIDKADVADGIAFHSKLKALCESANPKDDKARKSSPPVPIKGNEPRE